MKASSFTTSRLLFRPFSIDDVKLMQRLDSDPEVVRFLGNGKIKSRDESKQSLEKILKDYQTHGLGLFAVYDLKSGDFLGRSGLIPWLMNDRLTWEIGYSFLKSAWGKGYATESARLFAGWAKENLDADCLVSLIHPLNKGSIRVAEKIGMRFSNPFQMGELSLSMFKLHLKP